MTDDDCLRSLLGEDVEISHDEGRTWRISTEKASRTISGLMPEADLDQHCYQGITYDFTDDGRGQITEAVLLVREPGPGMPGAVMNVIHTMAAGQYDDYPEAQYEGVIRLFDGDGAERREALDAAMVGYQAMWAEGMVIEVRERLNLLSSCDPRALVGSREHLKRMLEAMDDMHRTHATNLED